MKTYTVKVTQKMCDMVLNSGTVKSRLTGTNEYINITESDCEEHNYFPFEMKFCLVSESSPERYAQKNKGLYHSNNVLRIAEETANFEIFENETNSDFYTLFEIKEKMMLEAC